MKKNFKILMIVVLLLMALTGCESNNQGTKLDGINAYNGVYKNEKTTLYVIATDKDELEYYFLDSNDDKNYGSLKYKGGKAIYEFIDEIIKLTLDNDTLLVETENVEDIPNGTYNRVSNYTIDQYYEDCYGFSKYIDSKYSGKYTNNDGKVYMYQPIKNHIEIFASVKDSIVECYVDFDEQDDLSCEIFDTKYIFDLDNDKLTFKIESTEGANYDGVFTKTGSMTKTEIINNFSPFTLLYEENL